jgi:hypothetical protein
VASPDDQFDHQMRHIYRLIRSLDLRKGTSHTPSPAPARTLTLGSCCLAIPLTWCAACRRGAEGGPAGIPANTMIGMAKSQFPFPEPGTFLLVNERAENRPFECTCLSIAVTPMDMSELVTGSLGTAGHQVSELACGATTRLGERMLGPRTGTAIRQGPPNESHGTPGQPLADNGGCAAADDVSTVEDGLGRSEAGLDREPAALGP